MKSTNNLSGAADAGHVNDSLLLVKRYASCLQTLRPKVTGIEDTGKDGIKLPSPRVEIAVFLTSDVVNFEPPSTIAVKKAIDNDSTLVFRVDCDSPKQTAASAWLYTNYFELDEDEAACTTICVVLNDKHHNDKHHNDKHHNDKHHNDKHQTKILIPAEDPSLGVSDDSIDNGNYTFQISASDTTSEDYSTLLPMTATVESYNEESGTGNVKVDIMLFNLNIDDDRYEDESKMLIPGYELGTPVNGNINGEDKMILPVILVAKSVDRDEKSTYNTFKTSLTYPRFSNQDAIDIIGVCFAPTGDPNDPHDLILRMIYRHIMTDPAPLPRGTYVIVEHPH